MLEETAPKKRKGRKPKAVILEAALEAEVALLAKEILLERSAEARKTAAIEIAAKRLYEALELLRIAGNAVVTSTLTPKPAPLPTAPIHACVICGRESKWQDKKHGGGWYCTLHAAQVMADDREEAISGGLMGALRNAKPINDAELPQ